MDIVELEYCLFGPEESEVDIRHIAMNARGKKRRRLFHIFCGQGQSVFLVVSASRWDEYSRMRVRQEEECQELSKVIKDMSERQGKLFGLMDRRRSLMSEAPEELRKQIFQEIKDLAKKISGTVGDQGDFGGMVERREGCRSGGRESQGFCLRSRHSARQLLDLEVPKQRFDSVWLT